MPCSYSNIQILSGKEKYDPKDDESEDHEFSEDEESMEIEEGSPWSTCHWCEKPIDDSSLITCPTASCKMRAHLSCLASDFLEQEGNSLDLLPTTGQCSYCLHTLSWPNLVQRKNRKQRCNRENESDDSQQPKKKKKKTS